MSGITLKEVGGDLVVDVAQESTVIGRGQFLQITDKRVSRSHALLELADGKLYITPTHTNPCFLRTDASKEQTVLTRDVKHLLNSGDEFGLLPDQLFYKVHYPQLNGKQSESIKDAKEEKEEKEETSKDQDGIKPEAVSNGGANVTKEETTDAKIDKRDVETDKVKPVLEKKEIGEGTEEGSNKKQEAKEEKDEEKDVEEEDEEDKEGDEDEDMAMPVDKKRVLPAWMVKAANQESPTKPKPSPKKPTSVAVNKRAPGIKLTKPDPDEEDEDLEEDIEDDDDDEEYTPKKRGKGRLTKLSDDDYEDEEASDDDYTPEKPASRNQRGKGRKKKRGSDSEEDDFSDEDDDYSPRKSKTAKKTPKGKGKKKTPSKKAPARGARTATPRSRTKRKQDEDDDLDLDEDDILPRRRGAAADDDDETPSRRPQRAAKQKRGSYVDDPLIEEALEDFASEEEVVEDKDSDFEVDGIEDSGSDWERSASNSQKQKAAKVKGKAPAKPTARRGSAKKKPRRASRPIDSDDDDDDDIMEDDEPYVPRPSKRRGGLLSQDTEESDEDSPKKKRRRELCQYGKKCYRKNPVHFRTFCHPGDSSYDEDGKGDAEAKDSKKDRDAGKASPPKPSRPQRSTAGTKLVTHGAEDDDDQPDTYDYQDSFIDDGTQPSEGEAEDDSDYDAEEDIKGLAKEAKTFVRGKKK